MRVGVARQSDEVLEAATFAPEAAPRPAAGQRAEARRLPLWLRPGGPAWTWLGVGVAALGFVLIAVAWGQVAGEAQVYRQLPYVVSAGLVGLGLVMVGLLVVNLAARRRDGIDRDEQLGRLADIMEELKQALAQQPRRRP